VTEARPGPLAGIKVLDLTTVVLGPLATQILGDLGAEVIKIEPPAGDIMRYAGPARHPEMGHVFLNLNRNKRSLVLDLKHPEAAPVMLALAAQSDVLMHNMRPQAMARLGFGWERLRAANPEYRSAEGHLFYARCLEMQGNSEAALYEYEALADYYPGQEAKSRYARLLKESGRDDEAKRLFQEICQSVELMPKHARRMQKEWYDFAKRQLAA